MSKKKNEITYADVLRQYLLGKITITQARWAYDRILARELTSKVDSKK